jgi:hypothetical protein
VPAHSATSADLLVSLRQLTADDGSAVAAEGLRDVGEGGRDPVRCLEEDHRALFVPEGGQSAATFARSSGQEALEAPPIGRETRDREGGERRGRSRNDRHGQAFGDRCGDQPVTGVGHQRHACITDQKHGAAGAQLLEQSGDPRLLNSVVVGDEPSGQPEAEHLRQPPQSTGVLGGHHVRGLESVAQTG